MISISERIMSKHFSSGVFILNFSTAESDVKFPHFLLVDYLRQILPAFLTIYYLYDDLCENVWAFYRHRAQLELIFCKYCQSFFTFPTFLAINRLENVHKRFFKRML